MPHNIFYSTDTNALQMQSTAGHLVAVLDQVLVNGGSNIAVSSITRSGSVATATTTAAHGLSPGSVYPVERRLTVSGATQTEYNVTALCSITSPTTFDYVVSGSPATPATGSIVTKTTALGWTIAFTGTNRRSYQQGAGSNGFYLDVDDTPGAYANVRMYETMTAVGTGGNPFPTVSQAPTFTIHKSSSATNRQWIVVGNSKFFRIFTDPLGNVPGGNGFFVNEFGDCISELTVDNYCTIATAAPTTSATNAFNGFSFSRSLTTASGSRYMARLASGVGTSIAVNAHMDASKNQVENVGGGSMTYPAYNGGLYTSPIYIHHNSNMRATVPGMLDICHNNAIGHLDYFNGSGVFSGKRYQGIKVYSANGGQGTMAQEVTAW